MLPPLLDTASTKKFLDNDDIMTGQDTHNFKILKLKEDSIPLQYIRDNSKMSDSRHRQHGRSDIKEMTLVQRNLKNLERSGTLSPKPPIHRSRHDGLVQYYTSPLSVLQENPTMQSEAGVQSLLVSNSDRDRSRSISVSFANKDTSGKSKNVSKGQQRIKLPAVGNSKQKSVSGSKPLRNSTHAVVGNTSRAS